MTIQYEYTIRQLWIRPNNQESVLLVVVAPYSNYMLKLCFMLHIVIY